MWTLLVLLLLQLVQHGLASLSVATSIPSSTNTTATNISEICFVGTISGQLHALNSNTGEVLWSTDLGGSLVRSFQSSEARTHGFIIPGEDGSLFSMIEGSLYQYPYSVANFVEQSPLFHDNGLHTLSIFGTKFETIYQIDRITGRVVGSVGFHGASVEAEAELDGQHPNQFLTVIRHEYRVRAFDQITHREMWNLTYAELTSMNENDAEPPKQLTEGLLQQAALNWKSPVSMLSRGSNAIHHHIDDKSPPVASLNQMILSDGRVQWYVGREMYSKNQQQQEQNSKGALIPVFGAPIPVTVDSLEKQPVLRYTQGDFVSQNTNLSTFTSLTANTAPAQIPAELYLFAATVFAIVVAILYIFKPSIASVTTAPASATPLPISILPSTSSPTNNNINNTSSQQDEDTGKIKVFPDKIKGYGANGTIVLEGEFENRRVAVKRMQRALCGSDSSAVKEINFLIQSEGHSNVVRYFAREETPDFLFLALELCEMTLDQCMKECPPQGYNQNWIPDTTRHFLMQLGSATRHLHQLGIVHCDIKAQNVLVCKRRSQVDRNQHYWDYWIPKLSDMGLSRRVETSTVPVPIQSTNTNHVIGLGTVGWRAPELLGAQKTKISRSLDIFSLGCLFFYVLHGTHPFGTDVLSLETCIVRGDAQELKHNPTVLPETRNLVSQMIAHTPAQRLSSTAVLHDPFLWPAKMRLEFVCLVSNRLEREDPNSPLMKSFEALGNSVFSTTSWVYHLDSDVLRQDVLSNKKRKYDLNSLRDLLRYVRNKHHHFDEDPHLSKVLSSDSEDFLKVFTSCFPHLLPVLTNWVFATGVAKEEKFMQMLGGEQVCKERNTTGEDLTRDPTVEDNAIPYVPPTERKWYTKQWECEFTQPQAAPPANNFKTNLCLHFEREQRCAMGTKCGFAHGRLELRTSEALFIPQSELELKKFRQATTPQKKKKY